MKDLKTKGLLRIIHFGLAMVILVGLTYYVAAGFRAKEMKNHIEEKIALKQSTYIAEISYEQGKLTREQYIWVKGSNDVNRDKIDAEINKYNSQFDVNIQILSLIFLPIIIGIIVAGVQLVATNELEYAKNEINLTALVDKRTRHKLNKKQRKRKSKQ